MFFLFRKHLCWFLSDTYATVKISGRRAPFSAQKPRNSARDNSKLYGWATLILHLAAPVQCILMNHFSETVQS